MSTKTELKTEKQRLFEQKHLQNAIETVLSFEQSFKLYSYRIIDTKSFVDGINQTMQNYAAVSDKIDEEASNS